MRLFRADQAVVAASDFTHVAYCGHQDEPIVCQACQVVFADVLVTVGGRQLLILNSADREAIRRYVAAIEAVGDDIAVSEAMETVQNWLAA